MNASQIEGQVTALLDHPITSMSGTVIDRHSLVEIIPIIGCKAMEGKVIVAVYDVFRDQLGEPTGEKYIIDAGFEYTESTWKDTIELC